MFFENFSNGQIEEILMKRIEKILQISNHTREYFETLKEATIPEIIKNCKGNLKLGFKMFEIFHQDVTNKRVRTINKTLTKEVIDKTNIIREIKLTNKEKEILNYYIQNPTLTFITTTHLVEELGYNRTLAWNYLERLTQKGVLQNIQYGKPSKYQLSELFSIIYEERILKEMVKTFF
jgi:ribosomal protein S25